MRNGEEEMSKQCYSASVRKVVTAAILLLILEVNMIAIYTYTMVDNSDLTETPRKEDIVVRVKRVNMDYINTVRETTIGNILASVKETLHIETDSPVEDTGSGDGSFPEETAATVNNRNTVYRNKTTTLHKHVPKKPRVISKLPDAYVIGARTCGTETLRKLLSCHPQVATSTSTHYFTNDNLWHKGQGWYRSMLPAVVPGKKLVEIDEELFALSSTPFRLKKRNPSAKLIVILRDPLERTTADFLTVHKGLEGSGEQTYEASFVNSDGNTVNEQSSIITGSMYDVHLKTWLTQFNVSDFLFIDYFQMMTQPFAIMKKVERFLRVKSFFHNSSFTYLNKKTLCTKARISNKSGPICLTQDHPDLNLPTEIDEALKGYFTQHMDSFWSLVSNDLSVSELVSLIN